MEWYLMIAGIQHGPLTWKEVIEFARRGQLQANDYVWCEEFDEWTEAGKIQALRKCIVNTDKPDAASKTIVSRRRIVSKWIIIVLILCGLLYGAYDYLNLFGHKTIIEEPAQINAGASGIKVSGTLTLGTYKIEYDEIFMDDSDGNGTKDRRSYYKNGLLVLAAWDTNKDGKNDLWLRFKDGDYADLEADDSDNDGSLDKIVRVDKNEKVSGISIYEKKDRIFKLDKIPAIKNINLDKWSGLNSILYTVLFFLAVFIVTKVLGRAKTARRNDDDKKDL